MEVFVVHVMITLFHFDQIMILTEIYLVDLKYTLYMIIQNQTISQTGQKEYIQTYINDFESNLLSDDFDDLENGYLSYIDLDSFINFFIINEIKEH